MNRSLAMICMCIAALGLLVLARSTYCTVIYGHGNMEAGNFHRCVYTAERDPKTGTILRDWDIRWEITESSQFAQIVDMWFLGIGLGVLGAGIYIGDWSSSRGQSHNS